MPPERWIARLRAASFIALACLALATPARALRIVDYNVTNYPGVLFPQRQPYFRAIFTPLNADIVVSQEFTSQAGVDSFAANVLNAIEPGQWAAAPWFNGNDTDNALFYKPAKVQILGAWAFYPNPANLLRYVTVWRIRPIGYASEQAQFRIYSQHLKASTGFESQRLAECVGIRDSMNAMPPGSRGMVLGDFNFYKSSTEPGYGKLQENQVNNIGRVYDPLNPTLAVQDWHDNASFATIHSQCPCVTCPSGSGFSGGGLDDRFDQILPTLNMQGPQGLAIVPGSYVVIGQDGQHLNKNITDAPTIPEGTAYANALWNASDHLPSRIDLQVPSKIAVDTTPLAFGTVIVGATASQNVSVTNPAVPPADDLDYSFTAPAGFTAPGGGLVLAAGAPPAVSAIGMSTGSSGNESGTLTITSDDPDNPTTSINLSGTVLDHAVASLDSTSAVVGASLDFGDHEAGQFTDQDVRVHDLGYHALQARLSVNGGSITSGDGRFTIVGGFTGALLGGTGKTYTIDFNDAGATPDSVYDATLTFTSADEALPGATAASDLVVTLRAKPLSPAVGVPPGEPLPTTTRLYAPVPNPMIAGAIVRFDLAQAADPRVEIFDLSGRRVASLVDHALPAGRYTLHWEGRDRNGAAVGSGLYFVRLSGRDVPAQTVRLAKVR